MIGPTGARMQDAVKTVLAEDARSAPSPSDWIYVNNFVDIEKPIAIALPARRAGKFQEKMRKLIDDLKSALPGVFQSEDYQKRRSAIDEAFQRSRRRHFPRFTTKATEKGVIILRTPLGFTMAGGAKWGGDTARRIQCFARG